MGRVARPYLCLGAAFDEPLERELADRLEHPEALVRVADQALLDERLQRVEIGVSHAFGRLQRATAPEHGEPGEQSSLLVVEQIVAPGDRGAKGQLARVGVSSALEQVQPLGQALKNLRRGEHAGASGSQFQRKRQVVESTAELGDRLVRLEPRALAEKLDRLRLREGRDRILDLAVDPQQLPARDHQLQVGAVLEQRAELRRRLDDLLEVVEQQEEVALGDVLCKALLRPERLCDRLCDERRLAQRGEPDPEDAGHERRHEVGGSLEGEPGLAGTAGPAERDHASAVAEHVHDLVSLFLPPDEGGRRPRQVGVRDRLQRRKVLLPELEERDRLGEVLQSVLAELGQVTLDELPRHRREHDLAAVAARSDPRRPM